MISDNLVTFFITAFSALFTIINPFSAASIFLTITHGDSEKKRRKMVKKACLVAAIVLFLFAFAGNFILSFFGITVDAFMIAGGIIIAITGFNMVQTKRNRFRSETEKKEAMEKEDVSVVPLAIPLLTGPGAMTTAIVLMGQTTTYVEVGAFVIAAFIAFLITFIILFNASKLEKHIGETERNIIERILGLIVMVVGVQFVVNGLASIFGSLGFV